MNNVKLKTSTWWSLRQFFVVFVPPDVFMLLCQAKLSKRTFTTTTTTSTTTTTKQQNAFFLRSCSNALPIVKHLFLAYFTSFITLKFFTEIITLGLEKTFVSLYYLQFTFLICISLIRLSLYPILLSHSLFLTLCFT